MGEQWDVFSVFLYIFKYNKKPIRIKWSALTKKGFLYVNEKNKRNYVNIQSQAQRSFAFLISACVFTVESLFIKYLVKTGHW